MIAVTTTNPLTSLALDPRRYWFRAHKLAVRRVRRLSVAYEHAWRSGQPAISEWEQLRAADRRSAFCYRQLCRVMDWR